MREVAELVGAPEQTVYSQYRAAVERASKELRRLQRDDAMALTELANAAEDPDTAQVIQSDELTADKGGFISYRNDAQASLARVGNVVMCQWRERAYPQTTDEVGMLIRLVHARMRMPLVLVNDVHAEMKLPNAEERKALRDHILTHSDKVALALDVITNAPLRHMLTAVIKGMMLFTRSPTSLAIVGSVEAASVAIAPLARSTRGAISAAELERALLRLRAQP